MEPVQKDLLTPTVQLDIWASVAVEVQLRGATKEGTIQARYVHVGNRAQATINVDVTDIPYCLSAFLYTSGVRRGECYVKARLEMGGYPILKLFSGYLSEGGGLSYPNSQFQEFEDTPGIYKLITGTDPAAGAQISETVPTNAYWRIISARAEFVTDATVVDRYQRWRLTDGTDIFWKTPNTVTQTASLSEDYQYGIGLGEEHGGLNEPNFGVAPPSFWLPEGYQLLSEVTNMQAGDDWGAPLIFVEELIRE